MSTLLQELEDLDVEKGPKVRLFNVKPVHALVGLLCGPGEVTFTDEGDGYWLAVGGQDVFGLGGQAAIRIRRPLLDDLDLKRLEAGELDPPGFEDDPGGRLYWELLSARREPATLFRLFAVLDVAYKAHGVAGAFCSERVAELLHGLRDQRRSRARHLRPIRGLLLLLQRAEFIIDGSAKPKPRREGSDLYTGKVHGPVLSLEAAGYRSFTASLNPQLHEVMDGGAYLDVDAEILLLDRPKDHHNPHGNVPSWNQLKRFELGTLLQGRSREFQAWRDHQGRYTVNLESALGTWCLVDPRPVQERGRLQAFRDAFAKAMRSVARFGGPILEAISDARRASEIKVSFLVSKATARRTAEADKKHRDRAKKADRRTGRRKPAVQATRSGRPAANAPPP